MRKNMNKPNLSTALTLQQPKRIPAPMPQQPQAMQVPASQQIQDISHFRQTPTAAPTHDDIAKRAYEIYTQKGDRQGDSEQNWKQAEQELRT